MNGVVKFYLWMIKVAIYLAMAGQLKDRTLVMMGKAHYAQTHSLSYSQFTRQLTAK